MTEPRLYVPVVEGNCRQLARCKPSRAPVYNSSRETLIKLSNFHWGSL
jgi:hypothetical protein